MIKVSNYEMMKTVVLLSSLGEVKTTKYWLGVLGMESVNEVREELKLYSE